MRPTKGQSRDKENEPVERPPKWQKTGPTRYNRGARKCEGNEAGDSQEKAQNGNMLSTPNTLKLELRVVM